MPKQGLPEDRTERSSLHIPPAHGVRQGRQGNIPWRYMEECMGLLPANYRVATVAPRRVILARKVSELTKSLAEVIDDPSLDVR